MVALVETGRTRARRPETAEVRLGSARALLVTVPERTVKRPRRLSRACRAAAAMAKDAGASAVCFREDFPGRALFDGSGLRELSERPLLERTAADVLALSSPEGVCAAVFCGAVTENVKRTVQTLTGSFRYVLLCTASCRAGLVREVGERLGASIAENETMLETADAAVFFEPPPRAVRLPAACAALFLTGARPENVSGGKTIASVRFAAPPRLEEALPEGYPRGALLAYLASAGVPGAEAIRPVSLTSE